MSEGNDDLLLKVSATANRLRLVAADFAEAGAQVRRTHLSDEIERALGSIVPGERQAFLKALEDRFPAWGGQARLAPAAPAGGPGGGQQPLSQADQKELGDPSFLVTRLCELAPALSPDAKEALVDRLREAGVIPSSAGLPWSEEALQALRSKLQLGEQRKIDPGRLMELTLQLVDLAASLHQLVGTAWRTIAPSADVKHRQGSLVSTMGRFVGGDGGVNKGHVAGDIEKLRQLIASLIAAIGDVGRQFAGSYVSRFAPSEIKAAAMNEPGMFVAMETKCWRKYVEVWDTLDESSIEREIRDTIARFAETLLKGIAR